VLENGDNAARFLGSPGWPDHYDAQWNDDAHRSLHVLLTGESCGYFGDYADAPRERLRRALTEGFSYQGEVSPYYGRTRGEPSAQLPPTAFVNFLQNHDQTGNRARGERIAQLAHARHGRRAAVALRAAYALVLLAPQPPMLFMGEEWAASAPFLFFCDLEPGLATRVRAGRVRELAHFTGQSRAELARAGMPDPAAESTFLASQLLWSELDAPQHREVFDQHRQLLAIRRREIIPRIPRIRSAVSSSAPGGAFSVRWPLAADPGPAIGASGASGAGVLTPESKLCVIANLGDAPVPWAGQAGGRVIFSTHYGGVGVAGVAGANDASSGDAVLPPWSVLWLLEDAAQGT